MSQLYKVAAETLSSSTTKKLKISKAT